MVGVVLAAGYGHRLADFIETPNKCLIELDGMCLLDYNLHILKDFGVDQIVIVVGHNHNYIRQHVGNHFLSLHVTYVMQEPPLGIADAIRYVLPVIGCAPFFMCLADEILFSPTFDYFRDAFLKPGVHGVCGIVRSTPEQIMCSYTLQLNKENEILRLKEKPQLSELYNKYRGTGYCLIRHELAEMVLKTPKNPVRGEYEMGDWLTVGLQCGLKIVATEIAKDSININTQKDFLKAQALKKEGK